MAVAPVTEVVTIRIERFKRWLPQLIAATAAIGGMEPGALVAPGRVGWKVKLRAAIILAAFDVFGKGPSEVGRALGGRNHGAIIHAYRAAKRLVDHDVEFRALAALVLAVARAIAAATPTPPDIEPELPL